MLDPQATTLGKPTSLMADLSDEKTRSSSTPKQATGNLDL
jgi:hypothetical protein